jgi:hypothetical protein
VCVIEKWGADGIVTAYIGSIEIPMKPIVIKFYKEVQQSVSHEMFIPQGCLFCVQVCFLHFTDTPVLQ